MSHDAEHIHVVQGDFLRQDSCQLLPEQLELALHHLFSFVVPNPDEILRSQTLKYGHSNGTDVENNNFPQLLPLILKDPELVTAS